MNILNTRRTLLLYTYSLGELTGKSDKKLVRSRVVSMIFKFSMTYKPKKKHTRNFI